MNSLIDKNKCQHVVHWIIKLFSQRKQMLRDQYCIVGQCNGFDKKATWTSDCHMFGWEQLLPIEKCHSVKKCRGRRSKILKQHPLLLWRTIGHKWGQTLHQPFVRAAHSTRTKEWVLSPLLLSAEIEFSRRHSSCRLTMFVPSTILIHSAQIKDLVANNAWRWIASEETGTQRPGGKGGLGGLKKKKTFFITSAWMTTKVKAI